MLASGGKSRAERRGAFRTGLLFPRFYELHPSARLSPTVYRPRLPPSETQVVAKARFLYTVAASRLYASNWTCLQKGGPSAGFLKHVGSPFYLLPHQESHPENCVGVPCSALTIAHSRRLRLSATAMAAEARILCRLVPWRRWLPFGLHAHTGPYD